MYFIKIYLQQSESEQLDIISLPKIPMYHQMKTMPKHDPGKATNNPENAPNRTYLKLDYWKNCNQ